MSRESYRGEERVIMSNGELNTESAGQPAASTSLIEKPVSQPALISSPDYAIGAATVRDAVEASEASRYLHALRRKWILALLISLPICASAAFLTWRFMPKKFTSTSILQFKMNDSIMLFETADSKISTQQGTFDVYKRSQRQWMKSSFVISAALRDLQTSKIPALQKEPDPAQWIEQNLDVKFPEDAELGIVGVTSDQPEGLHLLINAVVDAYFKEVVYVEKERRIRRMTQLELAYKSAENKFRTKQSELKNMAEAQHQAIDPNAAMYVHQGLMSELQMVSSDLYRTQHNRRGLESELEFLEKADADETLKSLVPERDVLMAMKTDGDTKTITVKRDRAKRDVEAMKKGMDPNNKKQLDNLARFTKTLEDLEAQLENRKSEIRAELALLKQDPNGGGIDGIKRRLDQVKAEETRLTGRKGELELEAKKIGRQSIDVEMLRREVAALDDVRSKLQAELDKTSIEMGVDSGEESYGRVIRKQKAQPARAEKTTAKMAKVAGAAAAAFVLPFAFVIWLDARKERINSGTDIEHRLGLSVIGSVPMIPTRIMKRLDGDSPKEQYWRTLLSESVDSIAAVLLRAARSGDNRIVMVSSAHSGEGKTTLAAHLATSLAIAGRRTALIDFDLRRPSLHKILGLNLKPGVCDVLRDNQNFNVAFQATQIPNLMFLAAGKSTGVGLAGLGAADLQNFFNSLRASFDFVVVDGSPLLPVVDSRLIAQHADSVVISVLRDVSCAPQVRAACQLLEVFGVSILGVVVTGSRGEGYYAQHYGLYPSEEIPDEEPPADSELPPVEASV